MDPAHKRTADLSAVALVLIAITIGLVRSHDAPPTFAVQPLAKNPPTVKTAEVEKLLSLNLRIVPTVQQVPAVVKHPSKVLRGMPFGANLHLTLDQVASQGGLRGSAPLVKQV